MADNPISQPTILVKKADGTSERITLEEFKKRKQGKSISSNVDLESASPNSSPAPANANLPTSASSEQVQKKEEIRDEGKTKEDLVSREKKHVKPLVVSKKGQVRRPIPLIPTTPAATTTKPIRRAIPLIPSTSQPVTAAAAETVIFPSGTSLPQVITEQHLSTTTPVVEVFEHPAPSVSHVSSLPKKQDRRSLLDEDMSEINLLKEKHGTGHAPTTQVDFSSSVQIPKDLEARASALILSWKKGIRDEHQFCEYVMKSPSEGGLGLSEGDAQKLFYEISGNATLIQPKVNSAPKPMPPSRPMTPKAVPKTVPTPPSVIQEVRAVRPTTSVMGPKEEIASFTIDDFRRLSRDPKTAASMVLSKFSGWKEESYLLYLQVRDSWRQSPLFRMYIDKTVEALSQRETIAAVLQGSDMTHDEYQALTEMTRKFEMMD